MSVDRHREHYMDGRITNISFFPSWCGHNGHYHDHLGKALWKRLPLSGWKLLSNGELDYTVHGFGDDPINVVRPRDLVSSCQEYIHNLMDEAFRQIKLTQAINEANAATITVL